MPPQNSTSKDLAGASEDEDIQSHLTRLTSTISESTSIEIDPDDETKKDPNKKEKHLYDPESGVLGALLVLQIGLLFSELMLVILALNAHLSRTEENAGVLYTIEIVCITVIVWSIFITCILQHRKFYLGVKRWLRKQKWFRRWWYGEKDEVKVIANSGEEA